MTPFEAYKAYLAIKLHFTDPGYDAFKYRMRVQATEESFWKRRDRAYFEAAARKFKTQPEMVETAVACFLEDMTYIRDMLDAQREVEAFRARRSSIGYDFQLALSRVLRVTDDVDCMFINDPGQSYPVVIREYLAGEITLEALVLLDRVMKFVDRIVTSDTILWPDLKLKVQKYAPFVPGERDKYHRIATKLFTTG